LDDFERLPPAVPHSINYLVHKLGSLLDRSATCVYVTNFGITLPETRIISTLDQYGDASARDLAIRTAMDKAMVSRVLNKLKKKGLVRLVGNEKRIRLRQITLTPEGLVLVRQMRSVWLRRETEIQRDLSASEKAILTAWLLKIFERAEEQHARETAEVDNVH
jgi:DNA-binding MarR family transcriptional regulator